MIIDQDFILSFWYWNRRDTQVSLTVWEQSFVYRSCRLVTVVNQSGVVNTFSTFSSIKNPGYFMIVVQDFILSCWYWNQMGIRVSLTIWEQSFVYRSSRLVNVVKQSDVINIFSTFSSIKILVILWSLSKILSYHAGV